MNIFKYFAYIGFGISILSSCNSPQQPDARTQSPEMRPEPSTGVESTNPQTKPSERAHEEAGADQGRKKLEASRHASLAAEAADRAFEAAEAAKKSAEKAKQEAASLGHSIAQDAGRKPRDKDTTGSSAKTAEKPKPAKPQQPTDQPSELPNKKNDFLKFVLDKYQEIAQRMNKILLYMAVSTNNSERPLERTIRNGDLTATKELIKSSISILATPFTMADTTKIDPLSYCMINDQKDIFNFLVKEYKKLYLYDQNDSAVFSTAIGLCKNSQDKCVYYLNKLLDNKFYPASILYAPELNEPGLESIKIRIADIVALNGDPTKYAKLALAVNRCELNNIDNLLKQKEIFVDWTSRHELNNNNLNITPLGFASLLAFQNTDCNNFKIVQTLLENGANANSLKLGNSIFVLFINDKNPNKSEFIKYWDVYKKYNINPFIYHEKENLYSHLSDQGENFTKQLQEIEEMFPNISKEMFFRETISTLLNVSYNTDIYGSSIQSDGTNQELQIYKLLRDYFADFIENIYESDLTKEQDLISNKLLTGKLIKSIESGLDITNNKGITDISKKIYDKSTQFPVIIPVGWMGHGASIIIYKDLLVKLNKSYGNDLTTISGARFYKVSSSEQVILALDTLTRSPDRYRSKLGKQLFDSGLDKEIALTPILPSREEPAQCINNCSWESSASYALHLSLAILMTNDYDKKTPEELVASLAYEQAGSITDNFKKFAQYNIIKKYIEHSINTMDNNKCLPDTEILTLVLKNEVVKATSWLSTR